MTALISTLLLRTLALLVLIVCVALIVGSLVTLDAIRPTFVPFAEYLPGSPRPAAICYEVAEQWIPIDSFTCEIDISVDERSEFVDEIHVYGSGNRISSAFFVLSNVRLGDVLVFVGKPVKMYHSSRLNIYHFGEARIFLYQGRGFSAFSRLRHLSLST